MINIKKKNEPIGLFEFRKKIQKENGAVDKGDYKKFHINCPTGFNELQTNLLEEQGYLCCYCMVLINEKNVTVEHFVPKSKKGDWSLSYSNLLACCKGNNVDEKGNNFQHCGDNKSEEKLEQIPNPSDPDSRLNQIIDYNSSGEVILNKGFEQQLSQNVLMEYLVDLNKTLNLNNEFLKKARKEELTHSINVFKHLQFHKPDLTVEKFLQRKQISFFGYVKEMMIKEYLK